ncbi:hypothetical protein ZIOFF_012644 [Zingiber officinale]|uniref:Reticulon-like protein n=1 Tax=Zingiber officinale TaxID=94328 RepID=A0A8J5I087_ZINOF|nr:hypothetical protein ZIOFF_012644 [Zingiber officinale]
MGGDPAMAEHEETLIEQIEEKDRGGGSSSSSDSDDEKSKASEAVEAAKAKIYRLFGREKPVHQILGGGKRRIFISLFFTSFAAADVFLWKDKKASAAVLGGATAIWILFELMEYHLLTLVCHSLILTLAIIFLWSNASNLINKSRPHIPVVSIPEDLTVKIALSLRYEINRSLAVLREIALGRDLKKFLAVIAGLWVISIVGNCTNFLTLFYIVFITLHTVPFLYDKYEDQVDAFGEKAAAEFKKHYAVVHAKYLKTINSGPYHILFACTRDALETYCIFWCWAMAYLSDRLSWPTSLSPSSSEGFVAIKNRAVAMKVKFTRKKSFTSNGIFLKLWFSLPPYPPKKI